MSGGPAYRWVLGFQVNPALGEFHIRDFAFGSARSGAAAGLLEDRRGRLRPRLALTSDGGENWRMLEIPQPPLSLFFLDDSTGWLVTEDAIYFTREGGSAWSRVSSRNGILRVHFFDEQNGVAAGERKSIWRTADGGRNWQKIALPPGLHGDPRYTAFTVICFRDADNGLIAGASRPPRRGSRFDSDLPDWAFPDLAERRREIPRLSIVLTTNDGGTHWRPSESSLFGVIQRVVLTRGQGDFVLLGFEDQFDWPSEVLHISLRGGMVTPIFRRPEYKITELAALEGGGLLLAGVEHRGRISQSPVPGMVKVLVSRDLRSWFEQDVDYRAEAREVFLAAPKNGSLWLATDTGLILKQVLAGSR